MSYASSRPSPLDPHDPRVVRPSFRALLETFDVATVVFDRKGRITYTSPSAAIYTERPLTDCIGANIVEFVDPDDLDYVLESFTFALAHPEIARQPIEARFGTKTDRRLAEIVGLQLLKDPDVQGTAIIIRDITLERTLEDILETVMQGDDLDRTLQLIVALANIELRGNAITIDYEAAGSTPGGQVAWDVPPALLGSLDAAPSTGTVPAPLDPDQAGVSSVVIGTPANLPHAIAAAMKESAFASRWQTEMVAADGRRLGHFTVWARDHIPPSPSEQAGVETLTRTAAFAVDRWQKDRRLEHAATHDGLTDLPNRAVFEQALDLMHDEVTTAEHPDSDAVVLYVDLDGFKSVNDRHGHLAGDKVLTAVAARLCDKVRSGDVLARLGGDEFAVLCRRASDAEAVCIADRIIQALSDPIDVADDVVNVGASIGIARHARSFRDGADWLDAADAALREAKTSGKSQWRRA